MQDSDESLCLTLLTMLVYGKKDRGNKRRHNCSFDNTVQFQNICEKVIEEVVCSKVLKSLREVAAEMDLQIETMIYLQLSTQEQEKDKMEISVRT